MSDQPRQTFPRTTHDPSPTEQVFDFDEHRIITNPADLPNLTTVIHGGVAWTCFGYDPDQINPEIYSAVGLPEPYRPIIQTIAIETCRAIEEAKKVSDLLPTDATVDLGSGLAEALSAVDRMISTEEPVAYLINMVTDGLWFTINCVGNIRAYIKEHHIYDETLQTDLSLLSYHLQAAKLASEAISNVVNPIDDYPADL